MTRKRSCVVREGADGTEPAMVPCQRPTSLGAALAGEYRYSETKVFPRVQILSMKEWFDGKTVQLPSSTVNPFKLAEVKADQRYLFSSLAG